MYRCYIVPPHLLRGIAESTRNSEGIRNAAKASLAARKFVIDAREKQLKLKAALQTENGDQQQLRPASKKSPHRSVYDAHHSHTDLPGKLVRLEGEPAVTDRAVNQAYENVGTVLDFYKKHFDWSSIDNHNMDVASSVHFGHSYQNACKSHSLNLP